MVFEIRKVLDQSTYIKYAMLLLLRYASKHKYVCTEHESHWYLPVETSTTSQDKKCIAYELK